MQSFPKSIGVVPLPHPSCIPNMKWIEKELWSLERSQPKSLGRGGGGGGRGGGGGGGTTSKP